MIAWRMTGPPTRIHAQPRSLRKYEAQNRAVVLEMIGDLPEADSKPPTNMLFVCKLNQVTTEEVSLAVCKGRVWA